MGSGIEELTDAPEFSARDARGTAIGEREWPASEALGHDPTDGELMVARHTRAMRDAGARA